MVYIAISIHVHFKIKTVKQQQIHLVNMDTLHNRAHQSQMYSFEAQYIEFGLASLKCSVFQFVNTRKYSYIIIYSFLREKSYRHWWYNAWRLLPTCACYMALSITDTCLRPFANSCSHWLNSGTIVKSVFRIPRTVLNMNLCCKDLDDMVLSWYTKQMLLEILLNVEGLALRDPIRCRGDKGWWYMDIFVMVIHVIM